MRGLPDWVRKGRVGADFEGHASRVGQDIWVSEEGLIVYLTNVQYAAILTFTDAWRVLGG